MHLPERDIFSLDNIRFCDTSRILLGINTNVTVGQCVISVDEPNQAYQRALQQCCLGAPVRYLNDSGVAVSTKLACKAVCDYPAATNKSNCAVAASQMESCLNKTMLYPFGVCLANPATAGAAHSQRIARPHRTAASFVVVASVLVLLPLATSAIMT
ncbi:hypothetical protein OC835_003957 [Tilletia horrida]|nr:hypothetical protein OC835_003957 [Tilletia horrida]KAK0564665.1 hypothetical protein OC844_001602 [Tilletia horrida]